MNFFVQERTYFIDYMKNHNALMMKEISYLRSSIMRRNAEMVDWLVDHVGPVQMQLIHKKPGSSPSGTLAAAPSMVSCDRAHGTCFWRTINELLILTMPWAVCTFFVYNQ